MTVLQRGSSFGCFKSPLEMTSLHTILTILTGCSGVFSYRKKAFSSFLVFWMKTVISYSFVLGRCQFFWALCKKDTSTQSCYLMYWVKDGKYRKGNSNLTSFLMLGIPSVAALDKYLLADHGTLRWVPICGEVHQHFYRVLLTVRVHRSLITVKFGVWT